MTEVILLCNNYLSNVSESLKHKKNIIKSILEYQLNDK